MIIYRQGIILLYRKCHKRPVLPSFASTTLHMPIKCELNNIIIYGMNMVRKRPVSLLALHYTIWLSQAGLGNVFTQFFWCEIPHGELTHYGNTESAFPFSLMSFDKHRFVWSCNCAESAFFVSVVPFYHRRFARSGQPGGRRTSASTVSPAKP